MSKQIINLQGKKSVEFIREMLSNDVNNILSAYLNFYAAKGYHSFFEVFDAISDPDIIKYFKNTWKIDINPIIDKNAQALAMNDTLAYTKGLCLRKAMHADLLSESQPKHRHLYTTQYKDAAKMEQKGIAHSKGQEVKLGEQTAEQLKSEIVKPKK